MQAKDNYLDVKELRLHYLEWKTDGRQPMVLLHGFMAHAHMWDDFASSFKDRYHVFALDQRGHGESGWSQEAAYTVEAHFTDIARFVEILGLQDIVLLGHSMGGRNALFYTACIPHNVKKLILVDARLGSNAETSQALRQLLITFPRHAASLDAAAQTIQELHPYLSRKMALHLARYGYRRLSDENFIPRYDTRMALLSDRSGGAIEDLRRFAGNVACPALIIRGEESPFLSRQDAQEMCKLIPKAEWREIPESTHLPVQENPAASEKVISDFLQRA